MLRTLFKVTHLSNLTCFPKCTNRLRWLHQQLARFLHNMIWRLKNLSGCRSVWGRSGGTATLLHVFNINVCFIRPFYFYSLKAPRVIGWARNLQLRLVWLLSEKSDFSVSQTDTDGRGHAEQLNAATTRLLFVAKETRRRGQGEAERRQEEEKEKPVFIFFVFCRSSVLIRGVERWSSQVDHKGNLSTPHTHTGSQCELAHAVSDSEPDQSSPASLIH